MAQLEAVRSIRELFLADKERIVGVALGLGYGSGWAAATVWLRRIMDTYSLAPTAVIFWRDLIVSAILFTVLLSRGQLAIQRKHLPILALFGFVGIALNNASWSLSVHLNGVTVATVMAYSAPVFVVLLSRPLYRERITRRKLLSLLLALGGCLLVSQIYDIGSVQLRSFGILMAVAVGFTQAGRDLLGKYVGKLYSALTGMFYAFLFGTIFLGLGQAGRPLLPHLPLLGWVELILMSAAIMASYVMYLGALQRLPVSVASILGLSEAVVAAFLAYLVHHEILVPLQIVGAVLVISGVAVLEIPGGEPDDELGTA